jgi:hypothetical protein
MPSRFFRIMRRAIFRQRRASTTTGRSGRMMPAIMVFHLHLADQTREGRLIRTSIWGGSQLRNSDGGLVRTGRITGRTFRGRAVAIVMISMDGMMEIPGRDRAVRMEWIATMLEPGSPGGRGRTRRRSPSRRGMQRSWERLRWAWLPGYAGGGTGTAEGGKPIVSTTKQRSPAKQDVGDSIRTAEYADHAEVGRERLTFKRGRGQAVRPGNAPRPLRSLC